MNNINNVENGGGFKRNSGPASCIIPTRIPYAYSLATFLPLGGNTEFGLDIVLENEWKATSNWNEGLVRCGGQLLWVYKH